jgi:NAD(P)-dependent dehydrogenase (short-subunit alcohol dehydrogenase family)
MRVVSRLSASVKGGRMVGRRAASIALPIAGVRPLRRVQGQQRNEHGLKAHPSYTRKRRQTFERSGVSIMAQLQGRVALVTGSGRGIGRAIALAFAAEGAKVAVTARTAAELQEVMAASRARGGEAVAVTTDVADRAAVRSLVGQVQEALGPVEILVNNAGIGSSADPRPVLEYDDAFWDLTLAVNLTAPYLLCKAVLPGMVARRWGRIINVASINSRIPSPHAVAYVASKHGLLGLTRALALEVAKDGITVNAICPGPVHTVMNDRRVAYDAQRLGVSFEEQERSMTLLGRRIEPDEIAPLAVYLAGDDARMMTGQALNLDGGICMA